MAAALPFPVRSAKGALLAGLAATLLAVGAWYRIEMIARQPEVRADGWIRYVPMARNLMAGRGFSTDHHPPYRPTTHEVPGYPLFLATLFAVSGESLRFAVAVQVLLELAGVALAGQLARTLTRSTPLGAAAALLGLGCVFLPSNAADFQAMDLAWPVQTALATLFALHLARTDLLPVRLWVATGALAGVSALIRVDTYLIVALALPLFVAHAIERKSQRRGLLRGLATASLSFLLVVSPWIIRDRVVMGRWQLLSVGQFSYSHVGAGFKAWMDTWADDGSYLEMYAWGSFEQRSDRFPAALVVDDNEREAAEALFARAKAAAVEPLPDNIDRGFLELAERARRARPFSMVSVGLRRALTTWIGVPRTTIVPRGARRPAMLAVYGYWTALLVLAGVGGRWLLQERPPAFVFLLALVAARTAIPFASAWGMAGYYLFPAVPAVLIFAARGLFDVAGLDIDGRPSPTVGPSSWRAAKAHIRNGNPS